MLKTSRPSSFTRSTFKPRNPPRSRTAGLVMSTSELSSTLRILFLLLTSLTSTHITTRLLLTLNTTRPAASTAMLSMFQTNQLYVDTPVNLYPVEHAFRFLWSFLGNEKDYHCSFTDRRYNSASVSLFVTPQVKPFCHTFISFFGFIFFFSSFCFFFYQKYQRKKSKALLPFIVKNSLYIWGT
jgi:hypothetical protein